MAKATKNPAFTFDAALAQTVGAEQRLIDQNNKGRTEAQADTNARKVTQYANMMAGVINAPRSSSALLTKPARDAIDEAMSANGVPTKKKGVGARLVNGAVALTSKSGWKKAFPNTPFPGGNAGADPAFFHNELTQAGYTTEAKITAAAGLNAADADEIEKVLRQFVGAPTESKVKDGTGEKEISGWRDGKQNKRLDDLLEAIQERIRLRQAVNEAVTRAKAENIAIADALAMLEGQADAA